MSIANCYNEQQAEKAMAKKTNMKIGFQTVVWEPRYRNLQYMLDVIAAAGYQGVQFFQPPKILSIIDSVLTLLEERGLEMIDLSANKLIINWYGCLMSMVK